MSEGALSFFWRQKIVEFCVKTEIGLVYQSSLLLNRFRTSHCIESINLQNPPAADLIFVEFGLAMGCIGVLPLLGVKNNFVDFFPLSLTLVSV